MQGKYSGTQNPPEIIDVEILSVTVDPKPVRENVFVKKVQVVSKKKGRTELGDKVNQNLNKSKTFTRF